MTPKITINNQRGQTFLIYDVVFEDLRKSIFDFEKDGFIAAGETIEISIQSFPIRQALIYYRFLSRDKDFRPPPPEDTAELIRADLDKS